MQSKDPGGDFEKPRQHQGLCEPISPPKIRKCNKLNSGEKNPRSAKETKHKNKQNNSQVELEWKISDFDPTKKHSPGHLWEGGTVLHPGFSKSIN